jgi:hypothetical protein
MDLNQVKEEAALNADLSKYQKLSEEKKAGFKKAQFKSVKQSFKDFFKSHPEFVITETQNQITADHSGSKVIVTFDEMVNNSDLSMGSHYEIQKVDGSRREIGTQIITSPEPKTTKPGETLSEIELKRKNLKYHKDYVEGKISYSYKYYIKKGDKKVYDNFEDLLKVI